MENIKAIRGFDDIFFDEAKKFRYITDIFRQLFKSYNFEEIILPVVEYKELFDRSVGEITDIVQKEMFVFEDKSKRILALRPEGTAGVVRSVIENGLLYKKPFLKFFYEGPMFRYERPQSGRKRQFHQIGCEVLGLEDPALDFEVINLCFEAFKRLNIDITLEINSIGCQICRPKYREALTGYLKDIEGLCKDCEERRFKNPLRVLDCKVDTCKELTKEAPTMLDYLCEDCANHYKSLKTYLDIFNIPYKENQRLVRGLDYYTKTVFEFVKDGLTLLAGGRYDNLVESLGGPKTPAIGFAAGIERIMLFIEPKKEEPLYAVIYIEDTKLEAIKVANELREKGKKVEIILKGSNLKKKLEIADKIGASFGIIIGPDELKKGIYILKNMSTKEQKEIKNLDDI
ncbi:histidine--tRNA ligase [Hydrogenobaculum acidophilum]